MPWLTSASYAALLIDYSIRKLSVLMTVHVTSRNFLVLFQVVLEGPGRSVAQTKKCSLPFILGFYSFHRVSGLFLRPEHTNIYFQTNP